MNESQCENLRRRRRIALPFYKQYGPHPDEEDLSIKADLKQSGSVQAPTTSSGGKSFLASVSKVYTSDSEPTARLSPLTENKQRP
jgi:hypothetical protein